MKPEDTELRNAVEEIAAGVAPPPPPPDLRAGKPASRFLRTSVVLIGAAVLAGGAAWLWSARSRSPVVVEYLRIDGKTVPAPGVRIYSLPEADAVVVRMVAVGGGDLSDSSRGLRLEGDWKLAGSVPWPAAAGLPGDDAGTGLPVYHVRLFRARGESGVAGSALFRPPPEGDWIPVSEQEAWGNPDQLQRLQNLLAARAIEAVPGLVIGSRRIGFDEPFRFKTVLGRRYLEIAFAGENLWPGQHRLQVTVREADGRELLATRLLVSGRNTVVLVAPLSEDDGALLVAVTPLFGDFPWIVRPVELYQTNGGEVTNPELVHRVMPVYPEKDRHQGVEGDVLLQAVVRRTGDLDGIVVLKMPEGGEEMAGAVVDAVGGWKYAPAMRQGEPVDVIMTIKTSFRIEEKGDG